MNGLQENQESMSALNAIVHTGTKRKCNVCQEIKPPEEFSLCRKDGKWYSCKKCDSERNRKWRKANPEKDRERKRSWEQMNPEKYRERNRLYSKANPKKVREKNRRWYEANKERCIENARKWRQANPEKRLETSRKWIKANPDKVQEYYRVAAAIKCSTPKGRLDHGLSSSIYAALRGNKKNRHWEMLVGYTLEKLMSHLEKQFTEGMSWENWGIWGWNIDHIIPKSVFNYEKPEDDDFKRCWSLKNLRPLWAKENKRKSNKLDKHFQPKLIFEQEGFKWK